MHCAQCRSVQTYGTRRRRRRRRTKKNKFFSFLLRLLQQFGQPLNGVLALLNVHYWHACDFANAALQIAIARGDDPAAVLCHAIHNAVIGVDALVCALEALDALVLGHLERNAELGAEALQLAHYTVANVRRRFGKQAVEHALHNFNLILNRKIDEIRI